MLLSCIADAKSADTPLHSFVSGDGSAFCVRHLQLEKGSGPEPWVIMLAMPLTLSCGLAQEQLQLTPRQKQQTLRLRSEYLAAMQELLRERTALNVVIQASAAHSLDNARVAEDHAKVKSEERA